MTNSLKLGQVCQHITYGVTASSIHRADGPRLLRITDITDGGVDWSRVPGCKISGNEHLSSKLVTGDIVVARTGGTVGKSYLISDPPDAVCASYLLRLRPNTDVVVPEYLNLFLHSDSYWQQLLAAAQGAAQPNVNGTTLSEIVLSVPKLGEQECIVKAMHRKLKNVEHARKATLAQFRELTHFAQALIFHSLKKPQSATFLLGDLLEEVKGGIGPEWASYPVLGATRAGLAPAKEPPGKNPERYKPATPGTVFYNPMRILIGSIAFVDDDDEAGITSPDYVVLRGKDEVVDSRWFYHWLRSPLGVQCINSLARGAVRERLLFNRLAEGEIRLPSFLRQKEASKALAQINPLRRAIEIQMDELALVPKKLLSQVFDS